MPASPGRPCDRVWSPMMCCYSWVSCGVWKRDRRASSRPSGSPNLSSTDWRRADQAWKPTDDVRCIGSGIMSWTPEQLARVDAARELEIAVRRADGTLRPWTPIWVVHVVGGVYVRTWYRRDTGWFGLALTTRRARVRVPGVEVDVRIEDVGVGPSGLREDVDDAYRDKYGGGSTGIMVGDEAAATTLRLLRK